MRFRSVAGAVKADTGSIYYDTTEKFQTVLDTLPEERPVPPALVVFGALIGQLQPGNEASEQQLRSSIQTIDELPPVTLPQKTARATLLLYARVMESLDSTRRQRVKQLVEVTGLFPSQVSTAPAAPSGGQTEMSTDPDQPETTTDRDESAATTGTADGEPSNVQTSSGTAHSADQHDTSDAQSASSQATSTGSESSTAAAGDESQSGNDGATKYSTDTAGVNPGYESSSAETRTSGSDTDANTGGTQSAPVDTNTPTSYSCEFCGTAFIEEASVISHATDCDERPPESRSVCDACGNVYSSTHALKRHLRSCDGSATGATDNADHYECPNCGAGFGSRSEMIRHRRDCRQHRGKESAEAAAETVTPRGNRDAVGVMREYNSERGFGFASISMTPDASGSSSSSADVFVHVSDCTGGPPTAYDRVHFNLTQTDDGLKAVDVLVESRDHPDVDSHDDRFASQRPQWGQDS